MKSDPPAPVQAGRWRPRNILLGADGLVRPLWRALAFAVCFPLLSSLLPLRAVQSGLPGNASLTVGDSALAATALLLSWGLLATLDRRSFRVLGLWFYPTWARELLIGVGIGGALMVLVVGLQAAFGGVRYSGVGSAPQAALGAALLLVAPFLMWALLEEVLFRGYGFQRLVDAVGGPAAIAVFSVFFAAGHFGTPGATRVSTANTVLQGALFAVAYLKTRALWMPLGLHFAWNYTMMVVPSLRLGNIRMDFGEPLFRVERSGPEWLSGGAFGPEGSVVLTVATAALLVWMVRTRRLATSVAMNDLLSTRNATSSVEGHPPADRQADA